MKQQNAAFTSLPAACAWKRARLAEGYASVVVHPSRIKGTLPWIATAYPASHVAGHSLSV